MTKWYKEGLYFKCTECGKCCTGFPGYVWLEEKEIEKIASFLNISKKNFLKEYTFFSYGRYSLKEVLPKYDCIFFKDKKCTIYEVRPKQCKTYPFWEYNLKSKKAWESTKKNCPGIDSKNSNFFTQELIDKKLEE